MEPQILVDPALDGATPHPALISEEEIPAARRASDPSLPLEERLEAFDELSDAEVGDTTMARARNVEREIGLRQLFVKFEGGNPTGTQKDRIAFAQVMDALRRGFDSVAFATCGNYGVAMALAGSLAGIRTFAYVPAAYTTKRIAEMESLGANIIRVDGDYEEAVGVASEHAAREEWYDANPGGSNTSLQLAAYAQISYEIYDELRDAPAVVAVPVSNGTTLAGIHKGFVSLYRRGKTSRIPHIVAGSSFGKNPIVRAFLKNLTHCEDLEAHKIRETRINEPLVNWHSLDGNLALNAIRASRGWAGNVSDRTMKTVSRLVLEREGLNVLPAAVAGLCALIESHSTQKLPNDRYVAVITGKR